MRQELQEKILAVCPNVSFAMHIWRGFECEDGWFELLRDLFQELNDLPEIRGVSILQCKTKFAELRVYTSTSLEGRALAAIQKAETRSRVTCELCGAPGRIVVNFGWHYVACETHRKPGDRERNESDLGVCVRWFGPSWKAPICGVYNHIETPSVPCYLCGKEFGPEDRGLMMPFVGGPDDPPTLSGHLDCVIISLGLKTPKTV